MHVAPHRAFFNRPGEPGCGAVLSTEVYHCSWFSFGFAVSFDSVGEFKNEFHSELLFTWLQAQKSNSPTLSVLLSAFSSWPPICGPFGLLMARHPKMPISFFLSYA